MRFSKPSAQANGLSRAGRVPGTAGSVPSKWGFENPLQIFSAAAVVAQAVFEFCGHLRTASDSGAKEAQAFGHKARSFAKLRRPA